MNALNDLFSNLNYTAYKIDGIDGTLDASGFHAIIFVTTPNSADACLQVMGAAVDTLAGTVTVQRYDTTMTGAYESP